jgi:hypothetical protein
MSLRGRLVYDSSEIANVAFEEARAMLVQEDPEFVAATRDAFHDHVLVRENVIEVDVAVDGPEHFWFGLESIAESLTLRASDGHLEGRSEYFAPSVERFLAGGEVQ